MTNLAVENSVVEVAGKSLDLASLPSKSILALISRGLTHYFGSEQASRVKAWKDAVLEETKAEPSEDEINVKKLERHDIAMKALVDGTIGVRAVGITLDPLDKIKEQIARQQVADILRANGIKVPKKDEAVTFPNGESKAMEDMIKTRLEVNGEAIEKEAKKALKARTDAKAAAEAAAKNASEKSAAALGL